MTQLSPSSRPSQIPALRAQSTVTTKDANGRVSIGTVIGLQTLSHLKFENLKADKTSGANSKGFRSTNMSGFGSHRSKTVDVPEGALYASERPPAGNPYDNIHK